MRREMVLGAAVAAGFPMEVAVLNVHPQGQAHVGFGGELFADGLLGGRPTELENGRVAALQHVSGHSDFHRAAIAGIGNEIPNRWGTWLKGSQTREIKRRDEPVGVDPNPETLD